MATQAVLHGGPQSQAPTEGPSTTGFENSVGAVVKAIGTLNVATLVISTSDNHRGSGFSGLGLILAHPVHGSLYFDSWTDLEGPIKYTAVVDENFLVLKFEAKSKSVAIFKGSIHQQKSTSRNERTTDGPNDFQFWYFSNNIREVSFSIFSGEIIPPGTSIQVYTAKAIEHQHDAFHIVRDGYHYPTRVKFSGNKSITIKTKDSDFELAAGRYNLVVGELQELSKAEHLNHFYYVVEFIIGQPPKSVDFEKLQLVHWTKILPDQGGKIHSSSTDLQPNQETQRVKAIDRATGQASTFATDKDGTTVDVGKLLADADRARFSHFGYLDEALHHHLQGLPDESMVDIVVWAHMGGHVTNHDPHRIESLEEVPPSYMAVLSARGEIKEFIEQHGGAINAEPVHEPYLYASIAKGEVSRLAELGQVGGLFLHDRTAEIDLTDSIVVARADSVIAAGHTGNGIRVAVHEDGPRNTKNLDLAGRYEKDPDATEGQNNHARLTHAIIKNVEPNLPHGYAPSCDLYSANTRSDSALEWALDLDCTILSQSFHRRGGPTSPSLTHDDILKDWKATRWPCPTFVLAAGNFYPGDGKLYVNHKSYNTLKVGSHHDHGLEMAVSSEYRNPPTMNMDRELPEVAANGTVVGANEQLKSGTSFAAPAVAGVAAVIQQINPRLKRMPEVCRAIILASANRTVVGGSWWGDICAKIDGRAGAGSVDAQSGIAIASQTRSPYARPSPSGWDFGLLLSETLDFDTKGVAYALYYVEVPYAPKATAASTSYTVKAALTWNSEVSSDDDKPTGSRLTLDVDLYVRDASGSLVAVSASFDNNYEIIEFYAKPGDVYELSIVKASGTPNTRYGIAWIVNEIPWAIKRP